VCSSADAAFQNTVGVTDFSRGQQFCCSWIGGHLIEAYEQNTQQSLGWGRNKVLQFVHS